MLTACVAQERVTYRSDALSPKTVTLVDLRSGESLLTVDVPVGQQLNMLFEYGQDRAEREGSDRLRYTVRQWGDTGINPGSEMVVPPPSLRRLDISLRKTPEGR
jgi:hypothetical protein